MNLNEECLLYFLEDTKRLNQSIEKLKNYMSPVVKNKLTKPHLGNKILRADV